MKIPPPNATTRNSAHRTLRKIFPGLAICAANVPGLG